MYTLAGYMLEHPESFNGYSLVSEHRDILWTGITAKKPRVLDLKKYDSCQAGV